MTVDLIYNPFTREKTFVVDGKKETLEECWGTEDKELSEWCANFFDKLYRKYNDSHITVNFRGILRDYEYLEDSLNVYKAKSKSVDIKLVDNGCVNTNEKLDNLKSLFKKMQETAPFPQLKNKEIKEIFEKAVSSDFEIAVVATMSSGKSTLINAMLGKELLPARNEATTAVLAQIHDIDGAKNFSGKSFNKEGNKITTCDPLTLDNMNKLNDNPETARVEIYGDIKGIESNNLKLILTDTPGPNNSRTDVHKSHTYDLITSDYKPMILYVLNGTQLETNDDNNLLKDVSVAMKSFGRQSQERFIFVLNKADEFDPEKGEAVQKKIDDVKKYLEKHGISNARVFPAASRLAKVIRQYQNRETLTETEEDEILPKYKIFIKRENKHFSHYAPLSNSAKKEMDEKLEKARKGNNPYQEALIYTGIPAIELAISEYLAKYALPFKLSEGVKSFKEKIENFKLEAETKKSLENNETEVKNRAEELAKLMKVLENGEKAKEMKEKIDSFSLKSDVKTAFNNISEKFQSDIGDLCYELSLTPNMNRDKAEEGLKKIKDFLTDFEPRFKRDIVNLLSKSFELETKKIIEEYNKYISDLTSSISEENTKPAELIGDFAKLNIDYTLNEYDNTQNLQKKQTEKVLTGAGIGASIGVGSAVAIGARIGAAFGPLGLVIGPLVGVFVGGVSGGVVANAVSDNKIIDIKKFLDDEFYPKIKNFIDDTKIIVDNWAVEQENSFKVFFKDKFSELDGAMKQKVKDEENCLKDKAKLEKEIVTAKENLGWINDFKSDLDKILEI